MENASKALIMAGAMIIGLLLAALMVWFFLSASGMRSKYTDRINDIRTTEFNAKFNVYAITQEDYNNSEGKNYVTIYDIVSVARYADEFNEGLDPTSSNYIHIRFGEGTYIYYLNNRNKLVARLTPNQDICDLRISGKDIEYNELIDCNTMKLTSDRGTLHIDKDQVEKDRRS